MSRKKEEEQLHWMEEELLAEEYSESDEAFDDEEAYEEDYDEVDDSAGIFVSEQEERAKRREQRGMAFMTLISLAMAGLLTWWWLKWK